MAIIRSHQPKDIGHTTLLNAVIEDERLSASALGVLLYLLSKSPGWIIREADIRRRFGYGEDAYRRDFRCLEDAGYLVREKTHGDGGRIAWQHTVYDVPQGREGFVLYGRAMLNRKEPALF